MQNILDPLDIQTTSTNLTLLPQHHGKTIVVTATGKAVTISVGLPKGFYCTLILDSAGGNLTVTAASGVTATSSNSDLAHFVNYMPVYILGYGVNKYSVTQALQSA